LRHAAKEAYKRAEIDDPREDVDAIELFNPVAPLEILGYEALGLCETGEGAKLLREGVTDVDGELPVNASGGAISTNPLNTGGLFRTIQSIMLINNELDSIERDNVDKAVATDSDCMLGELGRTDGVLVLGGN
jgi:acetyl-CoA acetyltransferase